MAAPKLIEKPSAYLFTFREAVAFSNLDAGVELPGDREIMQAWLVKMTLAHGTWVVDELGHLQT